MVDSAKMLFARSIDHGQAKGHSQSCGDAPKVGITGAAVRKSFCDAMAACGESNASSQ
jgi:hypothetical protein